MPDPRTHELVVTMSAPALPAHESAVVGLPAWAPGSYMVRDFARHVYDLEALDNRGRPLRTERLDKQRWRVVSGGRAFQLRYRVFAFEVSVRTSYLDVDRAFWNGTSVFFYVEGELGRPCEVEVAAPRGWRVSTALPVAARAHRYRAAGYDELVDSPFEVGTHALHTFTQARTRFDVALTGPTNADVPRMLDGLRRIVAAAGDLFGGFPFKRYLFIIHCLPSRGGGLEHAASCTLDIAGLSFEDEGGWKSFFELAAHEFFHVWNVKRIHDRVLGPFDYERENHSRLLWFHEGFTEYMESLLLLRAKLLDAGTYVDDLGRDYSRYLARPGRNVSSLAELSFEAWIKLYKPAENHVNRTVSYYEKGKWAALVLDLMMRERSAGRVGVAELFQELWRQFGARDVGITETDLEACVEGLVGVSLSAFFRRYIEGREELPVPRLVRAAGVVVTQESGGGQDADPTRQSRTRGFTGLVFSGAAGERATVRNVVPGSPAFDAGLTYGDEVIAVAGHRVNAGNVSRRLADAAPGEAVEVTYFRQERLRRARVVIGKDPSRTYSFALAERPSRGALAIRRGWLAGT